MELVPDGSRRSLPTSGELADSGACNQGQFARLGDRRTVSENCIALLLDGPQDLLATTGEKFQVNRELVIHLSDQRQSLTEPVAGALDLKLHHLAESRSVALGGNILFAHTEATQIFKRKIDAALFVVDADVLPEIGELKRGAGMVRKLLAVCIPVAA